jgi:RNA polymerase-binding transcription factor DksA
MNLDVTKRFKDFYGDWLNEPIQSLEIQLLTQEWEGNTIQEICLLINATESLPITALKDVYYASNSIIFEHCHSLQAIQKEFLKLAPTELAVALYACSIDTAYFDVLNVLFHPEALVRIQQHLNNRVYLSPHTDLTFANWFVVLESKQDANQNLLLGFETHMSMFDFLKYDFLAIKFQQDIALQKVQDFEIEMDELIQESGEGAGDDQADAGTKTFEREHEMSLVINARDMVLQTERALERIDNKTYGNCEECGAPIGKARLQVFPRATLCMLCKQKEERR